MAHTGTPGYELAHQNHVATTRSDELTTVRLYGSIGKWHTPEPRDTNLRTRTSKRSQWKVALQLHTKPCSQRTTRRWLRMLPTFRTSKRSTATKTCCMTTSLATFFTGRWCYLPSGISCGMERQRCCQSE